MTTAVYTCVSLPQPEIRQPAGQLTIPYETDDDLDRIIYEDILAEADRIADLRNGFVEADVVAADDPDRSW